MMTVAAIRLNLLTPTAPILPGRGFYQLEEESLFVQVGTFSKNHRFFSFLESRDVRFDFDKQGRLIFIEVEIPRRQWQIEPLLSPPRPDAVADIRWLNFRDTMPQPEIRTNDNKSILRLSFGHCGKLTSYYVSQSVIVQLDQDGSLGNLWITDITDDIAGQEISAFRRQIRAEHSYYS
ncbi:MAG: hypothetical protein AB1483_03790 [Candidatus Zixiibacteriota bacterium]